MNGLLNKLSTFAHMLMDGVKRFYISACFTGIIFGMISYLILWENANEDVNKILFRLICVFVLGFFISVLFTLLMERHGIGAARLKSIHAAVSVILPILYFFFVLTDIENKYQMATWAGIILALMLIFVYFSNKKDHEGFSVHISYLIKILFIAAIVTMIVMLGLFLCTAAVHTLIYEFEDLFKIIGIIGSFCWVVLFVNILLAMLPKDEADYKIPKFFKVITFYTALPIYICLVLILYIYLGKILITLNFPSGQLNWFASFASLIGILLYLTLKQYDENKIVSRYTRLFGYIILPVIAMQCVAFGIRFLSYGLTSARYISAVLIGISIITAILTLIKGGKNVPYVFFLTALCAIITTTGYFNLFDIPIYEQNARLVSLLKSQDMLDENHKIIARSDLDDKTKEKIAGAFDYIIREDINKSSLLKDYEKEPFEQVFGFKVESVNLNIYVSYQSEEQEINISGYHTLLNFSNYYKQDIKQLKDNVLTIKKNNKEYAFELEGFIKELYQEQGETRSLPADKLVIEQGNTRLVMTNIGFHVDQNSREIDINHINGYMLEK